MVSHLKNHLNDQTSLYLRQHAEDLVDWYSWSDTALQLAKNLNKPIFLSIGYSACHWCHVMAEESFKDPETAKWLNQYFICIKVDAQERPDLDKVYQTAYQLMHQEPGGWPLTAMLTPTQHLPFFIGTYFPKTGLAGVPSFIDVITQVAHYYQQHGSTLDQHQAPLLMAFAILNEVIKQPSIDSMNDRPMTIARIEWEADYDDINGGFGSAPKFPHPSFLNGLMYYWYLTKKQNEEDKNALKMVCVTLEKMALSGVYDQVGGGFFRYAVDPAWHIPHFEKMLYDNAQLLSLCANMYQCVADPLFKRISEEVSDWILTEAQSDEGGFYSTWDSDTKEGEGEYYFWSQKEVQQTLSEDEYEMIQQYWGIHKHFRVMSSPSKIADHYKKSVQEVEKTIKIARIKIQDKRKKRQKPLCDHKVLVSWNALTIKAIVQCAIVFKEPKYQKSAEKALKFIYKNLYHQNRLYTSYEEGKCATKAYLEDYAHLIEAVLNYLQLQWNDDYFQWAIELSDQLLDLFEDEKMGGFYFTGSDQEVVLFRPKPLAEDSTPSGNGIAAQCLLILGYMLGNVRYLTAAEKTLRFADYHLHHQAEIHGSLIVALQYYLYPPEIIVICGPLDQTKEWQLIAKKDYNPRRFVFSMLNNTQFFGKKSCNNESVTAYFYEGVQCLKTVSDFELFTEKMKSY